MPTSPPTPTDSIHPRRFTRRRTLIVCMVGLIGLLAALAWFDNTVHRGVTFQPREAGVFIPHTDVDQLGVNAYNIQFEPDPANVTRTLELAQQMGARYIRMQMPWEDVEIHAKGDFEDRRNPDHLRSAWEKYDFIFAEMQRLGLEPIVRIDRPPRWARATANATEQFQRGLAENGNSTGPPDNYRDYADFVATVAARYRGQVRYIQIWNEPNLSYEWNWVLPEPERFTEMLRLAATAARQANPEVIILFPSLSPTDGLEPRIAPLSELEYLDRVYTAGGADYFDIMSAQAYGLGQPPDEHRYVSPRLLWQRPIDTRIDVSRVVLLHEVMLKHGDSRKAVWVSEFGYVSAPADLPHNWGSSVSREQQGEYLIGQLERARREWPWMGVMHVWFLRWGGAAPDPRDPTAYFAIVGHDYEQFPAYRALQQYRSQPAWAGPGSHAWSHPAVTAVGENRWEVRFSGTALSIVGATGPMRVQINGATTQDLQPIMEQNLRPVAENLDDQQHTLIIESQNGPPRGFVVLRAQPWEWPSNLAAVLLIGLLIMVMIRLGQAKQW
jgi:hypothetical protein